MPEIDPQPTPPPAPVKVPVLTVVGILIFALGAVLARVLKSDGDPTLGEDVGEIVRGFGVLLASFGGALPPVFASLLGRTGGKALTALLVIGGLGLTSVVTPGCAGSQYAAQRVARVDWWPGPPCLIEVRLDGEKKPTVTIEAPEACEPAPVQP